MKKINAIAWLITMLMTLVASPVFATDWGSENVTMQVGETKTLYLPSSVMTKTLKSVSFYSASYNDVEVVSHTNYSVKVKALKATSTPVIVRCDYYYYINNGGYTYQNGGAYDFKVTVEGETIVKPTKITIPSTSSVTMGSTFYFVPTVTPANSTYTLTWQSSDNTVASVNQSGMLTGISVGSANITVTTDNGKTATCTVTVSSKPVTSVSIKSNLSMEEGDTYTLTPTITPSYAVTSYTWSSDDSNVVTVSQSGKVTAKSAGTANITVTTDNGKTATCKVKVSSKSVASVSIKSSLSMEVGDTYTLTTTITPSDAATSYTWSSENSNVAEVSQTGVVTAKNAGTANVTVKTDNGKTATCRITIKAPAVVEYEVNFSIYGYEHGQVLYNGAKLVGSDTEGYGSFKVDEGSDIALTILPNEGYKIEWVWLDWEDVADKLVNNALTIRNISADTRLVVSFEKDDEPVVIVPVYLHCNVGEGGYITHGNSTIMGENKIGVGEGDDITIKIVANEGYHVDAVALDGTDVKSQLVGNELTIGNMTTDKNLTVTFETDKSGPDEPVVTTENIMTLGNVTANTGTTVPFPIGLNNVGEITAFQIDLHLPTGITLATDEDGDVKVETSSRVSSKHTVDCSKMFDGTYRIICYSTQNSPFTGNSGTLFNLMLNVEAIVGDGNYEVSATGIELSDVTGTAYKGIDAKGIVTVKSYMLGDVDGNGQHSINDVVCVINHVLNRTNLTFVEAAADLDGNGDITVNDAVLLIKTYILGQSSNARQATRAAATNGENYISIEDLKMQPGEVKTIEVLITNERDDIRGLQCDITLPSGISFLYDEDADDYVSASWRIPRKLALSSEKQDENTLRVAGVCTGSSSIYGNSGTVFTFKVKADENIMAGMYQIKLSNAELSYGEAIGVADRTSSLEITKSTSGIQSLDMDMRHPLVIYDLRGQRVDASKAKNGMFIVNGKKVVIK